MKQFASQQSLCCIQDVGAFVPPLSIPNTLVGQWFHFMHRELKGCGWDGNKQGRKENTYYVVMEMKEKSLPFFQDELMYMLRKLLLNIGDFPAQTSHILFNYLVSSSWHQHAAHTSAVSLQVSQIQMPQSSRK